MVTNNSCNYRPVQHAVQIGGANGLLASIGLGTASQLLISNGAGTAPSFQSSTGSPLSSFASNNTIQTFPADYNIYPVAFQQVLSNVGGAYNPLLSQFIVPLKGLYFLSMKFLLLGASTSNPGFRAGLLSGVVGQIPLVQTNLSANSPTFGVSGSVLMNLEKGDTISAFVIVATAVGAQAITLAADGTENPCLTVTCLTTLSFAVNYP